MHSIATNYECLKQWKIQGREFGHLQVRKAHFQIAVNKLNLDQGI